MLNRHSSTPLYEQVAQLIQEKVNEETWQAGKKLPSERELCDLFAVSRITIRQAIKQLEDQGILYRTHGVGTFISRKTKLQQPLEQVNSFQQMLEQQGVIASTKILTNQQILSSVQMAKILNLQPTDYVINLQLIGYGDEQPMVYYNSYFSTSIGETIVPNAQAMETKGKPFSTLDLYPLTNTYQPTHLEQTFEAYTANKELASTMHIEEGWPIFQVTSIMYKDAYPLEYREAFYRGDQYRFFIKRKL